MTDIITIIDQIGRVVVGKVVENTESTLVINNPVIVHVQPNPQTGQLQVQSFPYLFMEFIKGDDKTKNNWTFNKSNIAISDVELDDKILTQYKNINTPPKPQNEANEETEVIKIFEDDKE